MNKTTFKIYLLLIVCFLTSFKGYAQKEEFRRNQKPAYKNQIFGGYWNVNWLVSSKIFEAGYTYLNKFNDRAGVNFIVGIDEYILTLDYGASFFSPVSKFQLYMNVELKGYYNNFHDGAKTWMAGPFIGVGLIPSYVFFDRFELGLGTHVAIGVIWSDQLVVQKYSDDRCDVCGFQYLYYADLRLGYRF